MKIEATSRVSDRGLYLPAALACAILVVVGFGPTYYYRPFTSPAEALTLIVHLHGALMTAWIVLFVLQVMFVALRRVDLHRRFGQIGFALLTLIAIVSSPMIFIAAHLGGDHMPGPALPALALVLAFLLMFFTLAGLGLHFRRRSDVHKRLMMLAAVVAMEAGVSRLPLPIFDSIAKVHMVNDALLIPIVLFDTIRHRRLHPVFLWGILFIISVQAGAIWISGTAVWQRLAQAMLDLFF